MNENYWGSQPEMIDNVWQDDQNLVGNINIGSRSFNHRIGDETSSTQEKVDTEEDKNETELVAGSISSSDLNMSSVTHNRKQSCKVDEHEKEQSSGNLEAAHDHYSDNLAVEDPDDDFGAFEEISSAKLEFCEGVEGLLNKLMPNTPQEILDNEDYNKSVLLIDGGVRPMRCYNVITGRDRQYLSDKVPFRNTPTRGCIEVSTWFKEVSKICDEWISDEKGITNEDGEGSKGLWKGERKINVFKWTTKIENETEDERPNANSTERKRIGDKLLAASYKEANAIMIERIEEEKSEKLKLEQLKIEREKRFKAEKLKREEEKLKYNQVQLDDTVLKKKKNIFNGLFKGKKSKISRDHISHDKLTVVAYEQESTTKELSLKEQLELEGYNLDGSSKKQDKGKFNKRKDKHTENDEDNLDGEEDDDDEYETSEVNDFAANGYSIIGENENELDPTNFLVADDSTVSKREIKETIQEDDKSDDEFGSFAIVEADNVSKREINNTFEEFNLGNLTGSNIVSNSKESPKQDISQNAINLIDL
ncbi:hypothetical protein CANINC_003151 [Pichia inconspicua]|uniref:Uncharacterized protein n=1 Tax=Pichia inconspicua TaxID=52247 RepID=A0A4T0WZU0_9ASCO|nr:hypothetical protein CANINC_003151 [[Candida] inconspicua]